MEESFDNSLKTSNNVITLTGESPTPTSKAIQDEVKTSHGFVPKPCWIAHVLELSGKKLNMAPNRLDSVVRKNPCPPEKWPAIIKVLRNLEERGDLRGRSSL